eukprot:14738708-Ditylum_brightwellii.AAC.1
MPPGAVITALRIYVIGDSKTKLATVCPDEFCEAKWLLNHNGHVVGAAVHRGTFQAYTDFKEYGRASTFQMQTPMLVPIPLQP